MTRFKGIFQRILLTNIPKISLPCSKDASGNIFPKSFRPLKVLRQCNAFPLEKCNTFSKSSKDLSFKATIDQYWAFRHFQNAGAHHK